MKEITLDTVCQHYLLAKKRENCSDRTIVLYDQWLSRWRKFLAGHGFSGKLADLTLLEGQQFSDHLHGIGARFVSHPFAEPKSGKLSCYTIHQGVRIIRSFGNWLYKRGYTETHLFQELA